MENYKILILIFFYLFNFKNRLNLSKYFFSEKFKVHAKDLKKYFMMWAK